MCHESHINVVGKLWIGNDIGCTTYNLTRKEVEDLKPISRAKMLKYVNGKDFAEVIDAEGMFLIGNEIDENEDIITMSYNYFHIPWNNETWERHFEEMTYGV